MEAPNANLLAKQNMRVYHIVNVSIAHVLEMIMHQPRKQHQNSIFHQMKQHLRALALTAGMASTLVALVSACAPTKALEAGNVERGRELYGDDCTSCHQVDADSFGPHHRGLLGRRAGSVAGYPYSKALAHAGFVWTEAELDRWLADPNALVPGQRMEAHVSDPQDRADLIAYLKTLTP